MGRLGGYVNPNKPKYQKVNPTIVMLKIQQAITDNPAAKYILVSGYEQYSEDPQNINFQRKLSSIFLEKSELNWKWIVSNIYLPIDAHIEAVTNKGEETTIMISVPSEFYAEVLVRDCSSNKRQTLVQNHALRNMFHMYRVQRPRKDNWKIGLTAKNWKLSSKDLDTSKLIKFVDYKPTQWYVASTVWKSKPIVSNMPLPNDSLCPTCGLLNGSHHPRCPDKPM